MDANVMTIAERERLAYLSGDTQQAALLDDAQLALEVADDRIAELEEGAE